LPVWDGLLVLVLPKSPLALGEPGCLLRGGEEALSQRGHLSQGAGGYLPRLLVPAKKLFAHEEHSYTEAIASNVLVVPLAGADLLAILHGIAADGHSGAVEAAVVDQVLGQPSLYDVHRLGEGEEVVGPPLDVALGHAPGAPQGLLEGDLFCHAVPRYLLRSSLLRRWLMGKGVSLVLRCSSQRNQGDGSAEGG
jgi:hypothetical protein